MESSEYRISTQTIVKVIVAGFFVYLAYLLRDVLLSILTAVIIASAIEPITRMLERRSVPRTLAVFLIYIFAIGMLGGMFYAIIPTFIGDLVALLENIPLYTQQLIDSDLSIATYLAPFIPVVQSIQNGAFFTFSNVFGGVVQFLFIMVLSFYLATQRYGVTNFLRIVVPITYEPYVIDLWNRSQRKIGRWMQGQLVLAVIVGLLTYIALAFLGFEKAVLLAVIAGVSELIPIVGPIIAGIPAVIIGFVDGGVGTSLIVLAMYIVIQQVESQIIHPLVVNRMVGIPPIISIIALVIGGTLAGFLGVLIAVPVAAAVMEYINDVEKKKYS